LRIALAQLAASADREANLSRALDAMSAARQGGKSLEDLVLADLDLSLCSTSTARRLFWRDRRPDLYGGWLG